MQSKTPSLSVIIITKNEEDRIENCLQSVLQVADEIIVLDSGSKDKTVEISKKYTGKVYETDWPGYGPQKQRALIKAVGDWVLSIDADEALSLELAEEIITLLKTNPVEVGFRLPWAVKIFGKTLHYGRSGRAPLRLFRRKGARFSDDMVHEKILLPPGRTRKLTGRLIHYTHRDFGHYLYKNRSYAWLGAQKRFKDGKHGFGLTGAAVRAIFTFILIYVFRLGFLDGRVGFLAAVMYSQSSFNKYAGLWTLRRTEALKQFKQKDASQ